MGHRVTAGPDKVTRSLAWRRSSSGGRCCAEKSSIGTANIFGEHTGSCVGANARSVFAIVEHGSPGPYLVIASAPLQDCGIGQGTMTARAAQRPVIVLRAAGQVTRQTSGRRNICAPPGHAETSRPTFVPAW